MAEVGHRIMCGSGNVTRDDTLCKEWVVDDFVESGTLLRVGGKDLLHQFTSIAGYFAVGREFIFIVADASGMALLATKYICRLLKLTYR